MHVQDDKVGISAHSQGTLSPNPDCSSPQSPPVKQFISGSEELLFFPSYLSIPPTSGQSSPPPPATTQNTSHRPEVPKPATSHRPEVPKPATLALGDVVCFFL